MPVKSLVELATAACQRNVQHLESVGDYLPYQNVRPVLLKVDDGRQLGRIEKNSPQIQGETSEIWLKIIQKDFPQEFRKKAYKPRNPKNWYGIWKQYQKDHQLALEEGENILKNAFAGIKEDKQKNVSKIVDRKLLPRAGRVGSAKRPWGQRDSSSSTLNFTRGSRTKTSTGASVMRKVRRETKEIASIHGALSRPVRGPAAITPVRRAPAAMINDRRRAAQPAYRPLPKQEKPAAVTAYEERATFLSDSEAESDDESDGDALFDDDDDDEQPPAKRSKPNFRKPDVTSPPTSVSPTKGQGPLKAPPSASKPQRSGLLSNSYNPSAATKIRVVSTPTNPEPKRTSAEQAKVAPPAPSQRAEPKVSKDRPPASAVSRGSPPDDGDAKAPAPKKKAVNIFHRPKRRA